MKEYLCFPVVQFTLNGKKREFSIKQDNLPHLEREVDDWWDYWFTIGRQTFQLCGDYERGKRLFRNLRIYVYPAKSSLDDSERIAEITDVKIEFRPYKDR